jgi:glycine cleavage system H lipoate-binding protein
MSSDIANEALTKSPAQVNEDPMEKSYLSHSQTGGNREEDYTSYKIIEML